jgi:flagellar basal body-associated protein FliL
MQSNITILTQAHTAVAAKKRARREQLKEVVFDEDARRSMNIFLISYIVISSFSVSGIFLPVFINESSQRHKLPDKRPSNERSRKDRRHGVKSV